MCGIDRGAESLVVDLESQPFKFPAFPGHPADQGSHETEPSRKGGPHSLEPHQRFRRTVFQRQGLVLLNGLRFRHSVSGLQKILQKKKCNQFLPEMPSISSSEKPTSFNPLRIFG